MTNRLHIPENHRVLPGSDYKTQYFTPEGPVWQGIDLFCGAGGATAGIEESGIAQIIAAINHNAVAISSHQANFPSTKHFLENIVLFDVSVLPDKVDFIWMSPDCTHFSNANGGGSRDADSRTLAEQAERYAERCNPDYILVENVREFLTWGPLEPKKDKQGNIMLKKDSSPIMVPLKDGSKYGPFYKAWVEKLKSMGYHYQYRLLNSADFGSYTSRLRYFGIFAKEGLPIRFPTPTHHRNGLMGLQKWMPVRDVLDFDDKGNSIFDRKKPYCENTLARIYFGLEKHVASNPELVKVKEFLSKYNGTSRSLLSTDAPASTLTTKDRLGLVNVFFLDKQYTGITNNSSIDEPAGAITVNPKHALVGVEGKTVDGWILNNQYKNIGTSFDEPGPTLLASRRHHYVVHPEFAAKKLDVLPLSFQGSEYTKKILDFMNEHGISDITMRMLKVSELKLIQGFPSDYILEGNETEQKKCIGNSVEPKMSMNIVKSLHAACHEFAPA